MAKINRYNGNLKAPASAALGTERTLFGSASQADDLTSQFTADLLRGWGIVGPSDQPTLQDFNAMGYTLGQLHAYLHQMGVAEWNVSQEYHIGSLATVNGLLFSSLTNNNVGNDPSTNVANWQPEGAGSTSVVMTNANVTLTPLQAARSVIIITGTLTANLQLIFPAYVKQWQVINNTTGNFSITCKTASGGGVVISRIATIIGDGTNIVSANSNLFIPGVIGESRNAVMQIDTASATGTFTADSVIVGESVSGQVYRVTGISESINLATTGAGGMDTGLAPASGYVALYLIYNPTTLDVDLLARDATSVAAPEIYGGANMPAGYTASALISIVRTNASRLMVPHLLLGRQVCFENIAVLNASNTQRSTPFQLSISSAVPVNAKSFGGVLNISSSAVAALQINVGSGTLLFGQQSASLTGSQSLPGISTGFSNVPINPSTPQSLHYIATASAGTMTANIFVTNYTL